MAISGIFAVTFSIVFAYVADCTSEVDRSSAYGLVREQLHEALGGRSMLGIVGAVVLMENCDQCC